jgi:hypothetical protein
MSAGVVRGYMVVMAPEKRPATDQTDQFEDKIEQAIDDKRDGVIAADVTGMVANEELIHVVELDEGGLTPPA